MNTSSETEPNLRLLPVFHREITITNKQYCLGSLTKNIFDQNCNLVSTEINSDGNQSIIIVKEEFIYMLFKSKYRYEKIIISFGRDPKY